MSGRFPFIMKTIAIVTMAVTVILIAAFNLLPDNRILAAAITFGTTAYHFIMRLAVGFIIPKVTGYRFDWNGRWFQPRRWEASLYKKLRLKKWKGQLPTYAPGQFSLENQSMARIIQNMCGAEIVHEIIMVLSFLPLALIPVFGEPAVFSITSVLSALFDSLFIMAQRFNRPRLIRIHEKQEAQRHE